MEFKRYTRATCPYNELIFVHEGSKFAFLFDEDYKLCNGSVVAITEYRGVEDIEGIIFIDDTFMNLPEDVQRLLVYHELGHWVHGEIKGASDEWVPLDGSISFEISKDMDELSADRYAFEHNKSREAVAGFIGILEELRNLVINNSDRGTIEQYNAAINELDGRIRQAHLHLEWVA